MRLFLPVYGALLCAGAAALAQDPTTPTALGALKLLPKGEAQRLARIEAKEGKPAPERWHILVQDPKEQTGVHEYVIAGDELVASRSVSQFAESLKEADIIGSDVIKIDSDKVSKIAQQYALANNVTVATMNYELLREGDGAAPLWKISCMDETGKSVGAVVVTASKGTVVSHDGFPIVPATTVASQKLVAEADAAVGDAEPDASAEIADETAPATVPVTATTKNDSTADKPASTPKKKTATRSRSHRSDDDDNDGRPSFFRRAGGKLQRFFTGKDTISR
ncbi:hypothetical protein ACXR0O_07620 [Verrucomicrobiota bacterium sgz303538]